MITNVSSFTSLVLKQGNNRQLGGTYILGDNMLIFGGGKRKKKTQNIKKIGNFQM